jgi:hypothetical protein
MWGVKVWLHENPRHWRQAELLHSPIAHILWRRQLSEPLAEIYFIFLLTSCRSVFSILITFHC